MDKEFLIKLGLSRREAEVYDVLLHVEDSLASDISEKTKESRTNTYDTLKSLIKKGLVGYVIKNNKKYFMATNPKKLLDWIEMKKEDLEKERKLAEKMIPELLNLKISPEQKVQVEVFEGKEGFRTALNKTIDSAKKGNKEILMLSALAGILRDLDPIYQARYYAEKKKEKIKTRYLFTKDSNFPISPNSEYRYLPDDYKSVVATSIHGDSVIFWLVIQPLTAIIVDSKELAESYRSNFELIWKNAKK
jgi:sugar-specific transcriptional regulator TrmB